MSRFAHLEEQKTRLCMVCCLPCTGKRYNAQLGQMEYFHAACLTEPVTV